MAVGSVEGEEDVRGRRNETQRDEPPWTVVVVAVVKEVGHLEDEEGTTEGGRGERTS